MVEAPVALALNPHGPLPGPWSDWFSTPVAASTKRPSASSLVNAARIALHPATPRRRLWDAPGRLGTPAGSPFRSVRIVPLSRLR